jgi:hypothetical protein
MGRSGLRRDSLSDHTKVDARNSLKISTLPAMTYTKCVCPAYTTLHTWLSCFQIRKIQIFKKKTNLQVCNFMF